MNCNTYFRRAIHSSSTPRVFIKNGGVEGIIPLWETETKSEQEGGSYGN